MTKTRQTHRPSTMTVAQAWALFKPELMDMVDNWTDEDIEDVPERAQMALDIDAGLVTPDVLEEVENCLGRCWCVGRVQTAALVLLANGGRLDALDPASSYSRTMRVRVLLGTTWLV